MQQQQQQQQQVQQQQQAGVVAKARLGTEARAVCARCGGRLLRGHARAGAPAGCCAPVPPPESGSLVPPARLCSLPAGRPPASSLARADFPRRAAAAASAAAAAARRGARGVLGGQGRGVRGVASRRRGSAAGLNLLWTEARPTPRSNFCAGPTPHPGWTRRKRACPGLNTSFWWGEGARSGRRSGGSSLWSAVGRASSQLF